MFKSHVKRPMEYGVLAPSVAFTGSGWWSMSPPSVALTCSLVAVLLLLLESICCVLSGAQCHCFPCGISWTAITKFPQCPLAHLWVCICWVHMEGICFNGTQELQCRDLFSSSFQWERTFQYLVLKQILNESLLNERMDNQCGFSSRT